MGDMYNMRGEKISQDNSNSTGDQLAYIISMPDEMFKMVYPQMVEEFSSSIKSGEFQNQMSLTQKGTSQEDKDIAVKTLGELRELIAGQTDLIPEKVAFLNMMIDATENTLNGIPYRDTVKVYIEYCHPNAKEPLYANPTDAGCDVLAVEDTSIAPGETQVVPTGLKVAAPTGWMISVRPRSGMSLKTGIRIANAPGTIDSDYRNEVGIILHNTSNVSYDIHVGDRIAQLLIEPAPMMKFSTVKDINEVDGNRGGGFGHSGI